MSWLYVDPLVPGLLFVLVLALWWGWRRLGWVRWVLALGCFAFFLASWTPTYHLCLLTLEGGYRSDTPYPPDSDFGAIVVLAAGALPPSSWGPDGVIGPGTYVRSQHAVWLYNNVKAVPLVVSGGPVPGAERLTYASMMRSLLLEKGVPAEDIWTEPRSLDTYENTLYSAQILREHGIEKVALVTEAYHMPRAARCMRKQGIAVVPAPTGFMIPTSYSWKDLVPRSRPIGVLDIVVHEWVGWAWYFATGRI